MMGRSHVKQGVCAVLLVGTVVTATGLIPLSTWGSYPSVAVIAIGLVLGGAAAPDMDAKGASATRSFGWLTGSISFLVRAATSIAYGATRGSKDRPGVGAHRLLTHTFLGSLMAGGILAAVCAIPTPYGPIPASIALGMYAGIGTFTIKNNRKIGGLAYKYWAFIGVGVLAYRTIGVDSQWLLVWAIALIIGCAVHCIGDSCTHHGTPYWWMIDPRTWRANRRWETHHLLPERMRIVTGHRGEKFIMAFTYIGTVLSCGVIIWIRLRG